MSESTSNEQSQEKITTPSELNQEIINALQENNYTPEQLRQNRLAKEVFSYMVNKKLILNATRSSVRDAVNHVLDSKEK